jgi:hypothetical protein
VLSVWGNLNFFAADERGLSRIFVGEFTLIGVNLRERGF